jgi:oxygen-independent coproporphyrinogen-3 oxidase
LTQNICDQYGFLAYEVSNHAKIGAESIHNKIYWKYGDYAGIGPGAHGRLTIFGQKYATETHLAPGKWLKSVSESGSGESARTGLSAPDQVTELLLMGLRLNEGVDLTRIPVRYLDELNFKIKELVELKLVGKSGDLLTSTSTGRPVLNAVLRHLLDD